MQTLSSVVGPDNPWKNMLEIAHRLMFSISPMSYQMAPLLMPYATSSGTATKTLTVVSSRIFNVQKLKKRKTRQKSIKWQSIKLILQRHGTLSKFLGGTEKVSLMVHHLANTAYVSHLQTLPFGEGVGGIFHTSDCSHENDSIFPG